MIGSITVTVLGASGKTGRHLVARLATDGIHVVAVGRSAARLAQFVGPRAEHRIAAFEDQIALRAALKDSDVIVNTAEARFVDILLGALPPTCRRIVQMGTMRRFLAEPDEPGHFAARAEGILACCGVPALVIHPGLIYGHDDDQNVERVLALMRRWPRRLPLALPLPDAGRHIVQPLFIDDVVDALVAAVMRANAPGLPIAAPGPALPYAEMLCLCATAIGRRLHIIPVPAAALSTMALLAHRLGVPVPFGAASLTRASEDKCQSGASLADRLGVVPRPFAEGLRNKLSKACDAWA